jgi:hypothetical protein
MPKDEVVAVAPAPADDQPDRAPPRFEVELIKPHTQAGKSFQPGAKIKVTAAQRTWLKANKVIAGDTQEK